ncbi:hypothetical protein M0P65_07470 [Candidatus Gracilibacteria bacterium]|jgi:hypothetical protein|nr:hypothetical protein [Candidatus Gracilibacteria bacterium]
MSENKREQLKQKICDLIEKSLNSARLKNYKTDNEDELPLVDRLSIGETIVEGKEEIKNIVEQIYFDMDDWDFLVELTPISVEPIKDPNSESSLQLAIEALNKIIKPILYLELEAEKNGGKLNGIEVMQLIKSLSFFQDIAINALREIESISPDSPKS